MVQRRVFVLLLAASMLAFLAGCATSPPVQEMSDARQAIAAAEEANAEQLAPDQLQDARRLLADAEAQLRQEAFNLARINAVRARNRATQALTAAQAAAAAGN
jgi:hypothetical protein